jgi:hypothetical protein
MPSEAATFAAGLARRPKNSAAGEPTAEHAIELLVAVDILVETTGKRRALDLALESYRDRLRAGTELTGEGEAAD